MSLSSPSSVVRPELVRLAAQPVDKNDAIAQAAQMLVAAGCIDPAYVDSFYRREQVSNTFLGHGVAIPHGMVEDRALIRQTGVAVLQVPQGVDWNAGQQARLVVAIAAQSDAHIALLRRLTRLMQDDAAMADLFASGSAAVIVRALSEDRAMGANGIAAQDLPECFAWTVDYPNGLHARPANAWVDSAKGFSSRIQVRLGREAADAKALVPLLQLGARCGDALVISAQGEDAAAAIARMRTVITRLSSQEKADAAQAERREAARAARPRWQPVSSLPRFSGLTASPGLAVAPVHVIAEQRLEVPDVPQSLVEGGNRLQQALILTQESLHTLADDTARRLGEAEAAIFKAHSELLNDPELVTLTCQMMVDGHGVAWAWHQAVEQLANRLAAVGSPVLAARAADIRDVGRRVLARLEPSLPLGSLTALPNEPVILIAEDLSPSDTAGLDQERIAGLATALGGPTSHTAILARTLGLPAMVGGDSGLLSIASGTIGILDGDLGCLYLNPTAADLDSARQWQQQLADQRAAEEQQRSLPATTTDGHRIEIAANINRADQAAMALSQGADGVGLMRTEFLFLERDHAPDEDEQAAAYLAMGQALDGRPLIVRALDIGGDKQVAHLKLPREENPFLGVRGSRLLLRSPDLLEPQVRALYRAARDGAALSIMFPMITSVSEILSLRETCEQIRQELQAPVVPVGIMVEVPAAAMMADVLARHVDFFSIGTNDLTQYTLAIDRQHPDLAAEADSLHPAVLRLIRATVDGAKAHGRWVGVCGGIAGDPFGATVLLGLGVDELSMTPRDIPAVKARLRTVNLAQAQQVAAQALACETADAVRTLEGVA